MKFGIFLDRISYSAATVTVKTAKKRRKEFMPTFLKAGLGSP
jgi:hypothetical protein